MDVRDTRQNARRANESITTSSRRDLVTLGQRFSLSRQLFFHARFQWQNERAGSEVGGRTQETERETYLPSILLSYSRRGFSLGLTGSWFDRGGSNDFGTFPDQKRSQYGASFRADLTSSTRLNAGWHRTVSEETGGLDGNRENREKTGFARAEQRLGKTWALDYRFSGRSSDVIQRDARSRQFSHSVELGGGPHLANNRIQTTFRVRSKFFRQETERGTAGENRILLVPLEAGLTLDDTPGTLDPLEDDPISIPDLFDGDLESPTIINLGDSAPAVREFGGDYRNIQYDFGETEEVVRAILYVDRSLLLPELYEWQVFVTDDPEGRLWDPVAPGTRTITYREFSTGVQGWDVTFAQPLTTRFLKLVDVKLGETEPDLFVTELETYRSEVIEVTESAEDSRDLRADASVTYDPTSVFRVGYQTSLRRRTFDDQARDLDKVSHSVSSRIRLGAFNVRGRFGLHTLTSPSRQNTDVTDHGISASHGSGTRLTNTLSWTRSDDHSDIRDRVTEGLSLTSTWNPYPRLRFDNRLIRGERVDEVFDLQSVSYAVSSSVDASPFANLRLNIDHTERWVDQEAGAGFERFNDTALLTTWSPTPLIGLSSYLVYQVRDTREWSFRNSLGWSPYPGGRAEVRISGNTFHDTRSDTTRLGGGASVAWKVRRRVTLEGSLQAQRVTLSGNTTTPTGTQVHLLWSF